MSQSDKEKIFLATLAEQAERYDDMAKYMKEYMESEDAEVKNSEHRNLLSVAYKNVVGTKRSSWRIVSSEESKCTDESKKQILTSLREKVGEELKSTCNVVLVRYDRIIPIRTSEHRNCVSKGRAGSFSHYLFKRPLLFLKDYATIIIHLAH